MRERAERKESTTNILYYIILTGVAARNPIDLQRDNVFTRTVQCDHVTKSKTEISTIEKETGGDKDNDKK